jgi:hypothetical protein
MRGRECPRQGARRASGGSEASGGCPIMSAAGGGSASSPRQSPPRFRVPTTRAAVASPDHSQQDQAVSISLRRDSRAYPVVIPSEWETVAGPNRRRLCPHQRIRPSALPAGRSAKAPDHGQRISGRRPARLSRRLEPGADISVRNTPRVSQRIGDLVAKVGLASGYRGVDEDEVEGVPAARAAQDPADTLASALTERFELELVVT